MNPTVYVCVQDDKLCALASLASPETFAGAVKRRKQASKVADPANYFRDSCDCPTLGPFTVASASHCATTEAYHRRHYGIIYREGQSRTSKQWRWVLLIGVLLISKGTAGRCFHEAAMCHDDSSFFKYAQTESNVALFFGKHSEGAHRSRLLSSVILQNTVTKASSR